MAALFQKGNGTGLWADVSELSQEWRRFTWVLCSPAEIGNKPQLAIFVFGLVGSCVLLDFSTYDSSIQPLIRDVLHRLINNPQHEGSRQILRMVEEGGGADEDIESRIKKAKAAFAQLKPVWVSNVLTRRIKISLFDSIVKSVLLFGCETWRVTKGLTNKLQVFVNKSLRSILRVFWPKTIRNEDLWKLCRQSPIGKEIAKRKWRWIGHTVRRGATNAANVAFDWRPPNGKRSRGRPVQTWRRSVENELRAAGLSWSEAKSTAEDRRKWRTLVETLCTSGVP
ncbi:unnamed protein product [Plutella xylostella]|uniref:(diamondback moth) hypothetical protein n=1 Tax=Plutella xylostella TaxID=51655 RepID=A0A8S4D6S1_PLUXY|nr:unnamed protein product [Plutella xylostella]